MKRYVLSLGLVGLGAMAALAAPPQAPLQAPAPAPTKAVQAPVQSPAQSPVQSPVQKGGAVTAQADTGYRTYSYQPGDSYRPASRTMPRGTRPTYMDAGSKVLGRY